MQRKTAFLLVFILVAVVLGPAWLAHFADAASLEFVAVQTLRLTVVLVGLALASYAVQRDPGPQPWALAFSTWAWLTFALHLGLLSWISVDSPGLPGWLVQHIPALVLAAWWLIDLVLQWVLPQVRGPVRTQRGLLALVQFGFFLVTIVADLGMGQLLAVYLVLFTVPAFLVGIVRRAAAPDSFSYKLYTGVMHAWNRLMPWFRLPPYAGALHLHAFRLVLRQKNLHDTRAKAIPEVNAPEPPPFHPDYLVRRTSDGAYNDLADPMMGAANTRFGRNMPLDRSFPESEPALLEPSPRLISNRLLARPDNGFVPAKTLNLLACAWIQFMTHDWFHHQTPGPDNPLRIPLEPGDTFEGRTDFMLIRRTPADPTHPGSARYPPTYINESSHWWDGSQIYGNNEAETEALRCKDKAHDGELRLSDDRLLPLDPSTQREQSGLTDNWWLGLSILHTLFAQEHNALAGHLRALNPHWSGERIFHTARLINVALMAKIHTVEWTPGILGHPALDIAMNANWWGIVTERVTRLLGRLSDSEFISGIPGSHTEHHAAPYSLTEEFTSVYRLHPLLPETIKLHHVGDPLCVKEVAVADTVNEKVRSALDLPDGSRLTLEDACYSFGIAHPGAVVLHNFPKFLRQLARPEESNPERVIDLAAIDILRDRERGVPRYNDFRELLRMPRRATFEEITSNPVWAEELRQVYGNVDRVDLMVGMFAEDFPPGFGFSETAFRVFILMASRRIKSDRFLTKDYNANVYTQFGLDWISDNNMSRVLLRHFPGLAPSLRQAKNAFAPWASAVSVATSAVPAVGGNPHAESAVPLFGGKTMKIAEGAFSLGQWKGGHVHAYLLDDGQSLTLIDTLYDTDGNRILKQIQDMGRSITDLKHIILTHCHRSHVGGLAELKRLSGATVYAHLWEADILAGEREAQRVSLLPHRPLRAYPLQLGLALGKGKHPPCPVDQTLKDGDHVGPVEVIHTPGHTPGSLSFYWPERKLLLVGDVLVTWPRLEPGWYGFTLNFKQNHDSIGRLSEFSQAEVLAVGHGEPLTQNAGAVVKDMVAAAEKRKKR